MSEPAPERTPTRARSSGGGAFGPFTQKLGPLPLWAWMGVGLGVALAYYFWKQNKAKASSSTSSGSTSSGSSSGGTSGGTASSSLIPQFVNQVYNEPSPPSDVTVNNNTTTSTAVTTPPPQTTTQSAQPPSQPQQQPGYPAPSGFGGTKLSGTSVRLNWNSLDPAPANGYTWQIKDSQGNTKTGSTQGTSVNVTGLKPNTGYSAGVYATSGNGHITGDPTYVYLTT
jgi:hypothetical protein